MNRETLNFTTDSTEIQEILREYCKNLYSIMDEFLDSSKPPNLKQEMNNNLKRSITIKEIETLIKSLLTKKQTDQKHGFTAEFYQTFKELYLYLLNCSKT